MAVGDYLKGREFSLAEQWNGTTWTIQAAPPAPAGSTDLVLNSVSCTADNWCMAVGGYAAGGHPAALAEVWDGTAWTVGVVPEPTGSAELLSVSCASEVDCVAVGFSVVGGVDVYQPLAETWNGTSWTAQTVPDPVDSTVVVLEAVGCAPDPSIDCEAVGEYGTSTGNTTTYDLAADWNGTSWTLQSAPQPANTSGPSGVSCASADQCVAVGNSSGFAWAQKWDGISWSNLTPTAPKGATASQFYAVSCTSTGSTYCGLVGAYKTTGAFVPFSDGWNGTLWTSKKSPVPERWNGAQFSGVSCLSASVCSAVGYKEIASLGYGLTLAERWNGATWAIQPTPRP